MHLETMPFLQIVQITYIGPPRYKYIYIYIYVYIYYTYNIICNILIMVTWCIPRIYDPQTSSGLSSRVVYIQNTPSNTDLYNIYTNCEV